MDTGIRTQLSATKNQIMHTIFELLKCQEPPNVITAVDQAYEWIWRNEIFVQNKETKRLSDAVLAPQINVSRTPVRVALDRLAHEGLIHFDPRHGYRTHDFTAQEIKEIYEICEINEILALQLAVPNLKKENLQAQLKLLNDLSTNQCQSESINLMFLEADLRLHNLLINSCGNIQLIRLLAVLRSKTVLFQIKCKFPQGQICHRTVFKKGK